MCGRYFILIILWSSTFGAYAQTSCVVGSHLIHGNDRLTTKWNLEFIGADLAKEYADQHGKEIVGAGILDMTYPQFPHCPESMVSSTGLAKDLTQFEKMHGHFVGQLMVGPLGSSTLTSGYHRIIEDSYRLEKGHFQDIQQAMRSKYGMKVLNYSIDMAQYNQVAQQNIVRFSALDQEGLILVAAAGNGPAQNVTTYVNQLPAILVGAMNFLGQRWGWSRVSKRQQIFAPGRQVVVSGLAGESTVQDGTSLAAPLVSGSLINALKFLPQMNRQTAEKMLQATAIRVPELSSGKTLPMVNAYKLVRVAERVRQAAATKVFVNESEKIKFINKLLAEDKKLFDFSQESQSWIEKAKKTAALGGCDNLWSAIKFYRTAFFLSHSPEAKAALKDLYKKAGYTLNANFYQI